MAKKGNEKDKYRFRRVSKNIYQRGDTYYIQLMVDGKRIVEAVDDNLRNAQAMLGIRLKELKEGRYFDKPKGKDVIFEQHVKNYLENYSRTHKRSYQRDKVSARVLSKAFGGKRLKQITVEAVERYKKERLETVTPATVNREIACLKVMFRKAVDWGLLNENPMKRVKQLKEGAGRVKTLSEEDEERLLSACPSWLKPIVITALDQGMRMGEILSLQWGDIDLRKGLIMIRDSKSGEGRTLPMSGRVKELLKEMPRGLPDVIVFATNAGTQRRVDDTGRRFHDVVKKIGLHDFRFHDLRHVFATRLVERGIGIITLKELLGHKTLAMVTRYGHVTLEDKRRAIERLSEID
ncbi:MAG: site-specific integrase [Deltaproteobacteria bacterium]|nr:site-specific integrase [Deltaproteobacteria bacterium]